MNPQDQELIAEVFGPNVLKLLEEIQTEIQEIASLAGIVFVSAEELPDQAR